MNVDNMNESSYGYVCYELVKDQSGRPVDYRFPDMNRAFEAITGLSREVALNRQADEVLMDMEEESFDWISFCGDLGFSEAKRQFEQFSLLQKKWYKVEVSKTEDGVFSACFVEVPNETLLISLSRLLNQFSAQKSDYTLLCKELCRITGADHALLFLPDPYDKDCQQLYTEGKTEQLKELEKGWGLHLMQPQWNYESKNPNEIKTHKVTVFNDHFSLRAAAGLDPVFSQGAHISASGPIIAAKLTRIENSYGGMLLLNVSHHTAEMPPDFIENCADMVAAALERIQLEEKMQFREAQYYAIFEQSPYAIEQFDSAGKIVRINQACLDLFGIDDISYIKDYNLFDDPQLTNEQKETIRAGRQLRFEAPFDFGKVTAYPTRHSGISWFRVVFSNLSGPTPGYMMQIEDITLQKKAEAALVESEKRYRLITENTSDIIWVMDVESGRFLYVSPSVERLRGYTVEEVMAEPAFEALTPESREKLNELIPKYVAEFLSGISKIYIDEIEQSRKDGTTVWTETSTRYVNDELTGKLIVYGVSRDISERKAAEAKMRVHELQFQRIIENLPNMLLIFNPDFDILYINRKGLELLRIKQNEVQTLNLLKHGILPADLIDSCQKELLQTGVLTDKELSITNPAKQKF